MAGKRKFLWLIIFDTAYTTLTFSTQDLQDVLVQMARIHIWNWKDQFAMEVQKSSPLLILQIPWRLLCSSCLSVITQSCSTWLLAAIPVTNIKKQGFSHRPRDALSAEGVRAQKPMQYVTIPCTSEVCTVTEGMLTRVYLQVFPDHMQSLHGASTSEVLKTSFFHQHRDYHNLKSISAKRLKNKNKTQHWTKSFGLYLFSF